MAASRDRNPAWSRDETILLLDLYLRHPSAEARHPEVAALSATLRDLASETGTPRPETFRNPVGIAMKLRNLAQQDHALALQPTSSTQSARLRRVAQRRSV